jgi:hypothetical protein
MKMRLVLSLAVLLLVPPAFASLIVYKVTPDSTADGGATAQYRRLNDGTYSFTFTRYLANETASWPGSKVSDLNVTDIATLEIRSGDKLLARTSVAGEAKDDTMVFSFTLARECIAQSHFTLSEYVQHKDPAQPRFLGGVMFELDLSDIDKRLQATTPQHP